MTLTLSDGSIAKGRDLEDLLEEYLASEEDGAAVRPDLGARDRAALGANAHVFKAFSNLKPEEVHALPPESRRFIVLDFPLETILDLMSHANLRSFYSRIHLQYSLRFS